jgi:hypothetical protein
MAARKMTLLINWGENAGWSETYYFADTGGTRTSADKLQECRVLANARATVLCSNATIVGVRWSLSSDPKKVFLAKPNVVGALTNLLTQTKTDAPTSALLIAMSGATGAKRNFLQRGLIDDDIKSGIITMEQSGIARWNQWLLFLSSRGMVIRDTVDEPGSAILHIDGETMVMTLSNAPAYVPGETIHIVTNNSGGGKRVDWRGTVISVLDKLVQLKNFHWGDCAGGLSHRMIVTYTEIIGFSMPIPQRQRTRQTGRPFGLLRGRASAR